MDGLSRMPIRVEPLRMGFAFSFVLLIAALEYHTLISILLYLLIVALSIVNMGSAGAAPGWRNTGMI